jgi:hypothetical protein
VVRKQGAQPHPAESRSETRPTWTRREFCLFVDAAVWLGLVRVLRFLKLGSGAGDEVDASSCGGAVVTALAGSRLPGLRASSLVALEASLPCTTSDHVGADDVVTPVGEKRARRRRRDGWRLPVLLKTWVGFSTSASTSAFRDGVLADRVSRAGTGVWRWAVLGPMRQ